MRVSRIPYSKTGRISELVRAYLANDPDLHTHFAHPPTAAGIFEAARQRGFPKDRRSVLCEVLKQQYQGMASAERVLDNVDRLASSGTFTITTGHQACLFLGPMYLVLKVMNVIRIARDLNGQSKEFSFVPVFWIASEDHDRAEIDHAQFMERRFEWPGEAGAPVGRMKLNGIGPVLEGARSAFANDPALAEEVARVEASFTTDTTLAQAVRRLLHALFGDLGLVVIDADDARLKGLFKEVMRTELIDRPAERSVSTASAALDKRFKVQAFPRPINLFHMTDEMRRRIEPQGGDFTLMPGGAAVPRNALLEELEEHPERFSPNVIMRPLYQEFILPNCAYVGGGGELAYWFQLKGVFDHFRVPFPALVLRTSLMVLDEKAAKLQARLDLSDEQLFQPTDGLKAELASAHSEVDTSLSNERDRIADVFSDAIDRAVAVNEGLERAFRAVAHKTDDQLGSLEKKLLRHSKRKQSELMSRVDRLFERIFPAGGLQERSEGYFLLRATIGPDWRDALIEALDPLHPEFTVVSVGHDG